MDLSPVALSVYRSADPPTAFANLAEGLASLVSLQGALYVTAADRGVRDRWPEGAEVSGDLIDTAAHVLRPEMFPLASEFPFDAARYGGSEFLVLPLHRGTEARAFCLFIASEGRFGEDLHPWETLAATLEEFEIRHRRIVQAEAQSAELRRRIEESESLHTLGLAANRTLNKDEVLNLVARFTRTLLGAHYVTVNTVDDGSMQAVAAVGLRGPLASASDCELARLVIDGEKPLVIGGPGAAFDVGRFPVHESEGMRVGVGIPLTLFGDTFGALVVGFRREYTVTPRDLRLALTLAGHAAVAISNARLHAAVEERSRELAEAYDELNALTVAKERFFASINHELRNPLGAILGYHALILEETGGALPEGARDWLAKANRAAVTLRELVNDILDLSKLAAGKLSVEMEPCRIGGILEEVMNTIQPLADERSVPIAVEVPEGLPLLRTDAGRVQQVLVNLLSNAIKFTGEGGVRVTAGADYDCGGVPAGQLFVRVTDTGPGIPPDDLKRIFEEYEQVKGTRGGTGLGLPISRRLARALGGELTVESEVGVGSTFTLALPVDALPSPMDGAALVAGELPNLEGLR